MRSDCGKVNKTPYRTFEWIAVGISIAIARGAELKPHRPICVFGRPVNTNSLGCSQRRFQAIASGSLSMHPEALVAERSLEALKCRCPEQGAEGAEKLKV
jgi:hypothetical protein